MSLIPDAHIHRVMAATQNVRSTSIVNNNVGGNENFNKINPNQTVTDDSEESLEQNKKCTTIDNGLNDNSSTQVADMINPLVQHNYNHYHKQPMHNNQPLGNNNDNQNQSDALNDQESASLSLLLADNLPTSINGNTTSTKTINSCTSIMSSSIQSTSTHHSNMVNNNNTNNRKGYLYDKSNLNHFQLTSTLAQQQDEQELEQKSKEHEEFANDNSKEQIIVSNEIDDTKCISNLNAKGIIYLFWKYLNRFNKCFILCLLTFGLI